MAYHYSAGESARLLPTPAGERRHIAASLAVTYKQCEGPSAITLRSSRQAVVL
jgi:hypothetical protein